MLSRKQYRIKKKSVVGRKNWAFYFVKTITAIILFPFFNLRTRGAENLPKKSAFILLPKHQRWVDIPLLGIASPQPLYYIAKHELFKNFFSNWFLKAMGGIPLNRERPVESRRYLKAAIEFLNKGEGVVIFPEGTYYVNKMGPAKTGVVKLILSRLSLPFIPVGIKYSKRRLRTRVFINFGDAVYPDESGTAGIFLDKMMKNIAVLSELC
jgi:1-acyl-sn-glycerol-3-phosphate acyltransferase